jgi:hypothetical protein
VSIFAIAASFFGFVTVNMYLAMYGFWDFNFLKVQYFSAGGLFLMFLLVPASFCYAYSVAKEILEKYRKKDGSALKSFFVISARWIILIGLGTLNFFVFILVASVSNATYQANFIVAFAIMWTIVTFTATLTLIKAFGDINGMRDQPVTLKNIATYFFAHYRLLYPVLAVFLLIFLFSFFVYPVVPRYFGGGKPVAVTIGFEQKEKKVADDLSNPLDAFLIYESNDSLLLLTEQGVYLFKQDDIAYVKYREVYAHMHAMGESAVLLNFASSTPNH